MQKNLLQMVILSVVAALISACVGAGTVTASTYMWDARDPGRFGLCPIGYNKMIVKCPMLPSTTATGVHLTGVEEITPRNLIEMWGAPQSDKMVNGLRELVYGRDFAWRGMVVFIVIPIPLVLPLGHNEARFSFRGDSLVHVEYADNAIDAAVCGLHSEGPNGFGCIAHWH